jgi:hypothetical protein
MKSVFLLLILTIFLNYTPEDSDEEVCEPQHYSWDLGVPDNIVYPKVIYDEASLDSQNIEDQILIPDY